MDRPRAALMAAVRDIWRPAPWQALPKVSVMAVGWPMAKLSRGRWRRLMALRFNKAKYGQRWQAETVVSMVKRLLGSALTARKYWSQCRELSLRAITHNVMILWRVAQGFLQSIPDTFYPSCTSPSRISY